MDITPSPRILRMLGEIEFAEWQCIAELIDNAFDDFSEIQREGIPWPGGFKVSVTLPSNKASLDDAEVMIQDTGRGMARSELEQAVKAGWSSNDRFDKLGLFGMGFNVSTARLGGRTRVLTTRVNDPEWTGVEIDFDRLSDDFEAIDLSEAKADVNEHGTKIVISRLKKQHAEWLQRNGVQLRELLGRVYSWILDTTPVELWVAGVQVRPRRPCVWDDSRFVTYGGGTHPQHIPAVVRFDEKFEPADACSNCGNWQSPDRGICEECGSTDLIARERHLHGWVGIQRHLHTREFGLDFLRNGRKILQFDKRAFDWTNPNDPVAGNITEYPVELPHLGGRIIGEVHLDYVPVTYSKNAFEYSDRGWRAAMDYLRGSGPLRPKTAERLGYPRNISPIAKLIEGYGTIAAGRRSLIPGNGTGPIHEITREWATKFWAGEPEFQTDEKWWEAVLSHEKRKAELDLVADDPAAGAASVDEAAVLAALGADDGTTPKPDAETVTPAAPTVQETIQERLDRISAASTPLPELSISFGLPETGAIEVEAFEASDSPLRDDRENPTPVWLRPVTGKTVRVFFDPKHDLFTRFGHSYPDAMLIELVAFLKVRSSAALSESEITARLKANSLAQTAVDYSTIKSQAEEMLEDLRSKMVGYVEADPQRAIQYLSPDERTAIENGVVNDGAAITNDLWDEGIFVLYAPPLYIVKLVESWPEAFFDNKVFRGVYESLISPSAKRLSAARIVGYINDLGTLASSQTRSSAAQLQRTRWSMQLLASELVD